MRKIIKYVVVNIYAFLIDFWLFILNSFSKYKYIYPEYVSFGDTYMFYLYNYLNIKKDKKKKVILFGKTDSKIIKLIFEKDKYKINHFYIFDFLPDHPIHEELRKKKNFKPKICDYTKLRNKDTIKNLININFNKKKIVSKNLIEFCKRPYFLIFIKFYNKDYNNIIGSAARQTSNLDKVENIIKFLFEKKFNVLVIGNKFDKSINEIKKFELKNHNQNINFFVNLSKEYSLFDQLYAVNNSKGFIGNGCGFTEPVYFQKKKLVIFDYPFDPVRDPRHNAEFKKFLYKKVMIDNKIKILDFPFIENIIENPNLEYKVIDTDIDIIKKEIESTFNI